VWHVLLRPDIALRPNASFTPVAATKVLISRHRFMVRQKSTPKGSGGQGEEGVS